MKKYLYHYHIKSISGHIVFNLDKIPLTDDQPNDQYIKLVTTGKENEKNYKRLELSIVRLQTTIDGLVKFYTR